MIDLLRNVVASIARFFAPRAVVPAENLLLPHQLIVLRRSSPRPRLGGLDRFVVVEHAGLPNRELAPFDGLLELLE